MACLGLEPTAAGWSAQTIPLSYGGTPYIIIIISPKNLFNGKSPASFLTYFRFFETTIQCFQKMLNIN